jgi:hypothetical protein
MQALIDTVDRGNKTDDLKGRTTDPENEALVDMFGFLNLVEAKLRLKNKRLSVLNPSVQ